MDLLDGVEVACFDLFDTLIHIDTDRLPSVEWDGGSVRSTIPILHERIFASRGVALKELVLTLRAMWTALRAERRSQLGSDDERWSETPAVEKYRRMLRSLDAIDEAEVEALAEEVAHVHHESLVAAAVPAEGAGALLEGVRERGVRTVLVSNWDHARAGSAMLEGTGLAELLDHVVISEAVGLRKPHPKIFEEALAPFDAAPESALHVGDLAEPDAWGAGRLGFKTVWIDRKQEGWPERLHPQPSLTVSRLADLLSRL
jgi:HAD superfamily hydrolase (TIGR01509 family)